MSWQKYRKLTNLLIITTGSALVTYFGVKLYENTYKTEDTSNHFWGGSTPSGLWQRNWDCREPKELLQNMRHMTELQPVEPTALRHIVLVRHGEYLNYTDGSHHLTERGRLQARYTGQRLKEMGIHWDHVVASTMTRAQETAKIIVKELNFDPLKLRKCTLLPEGMPVPPEPATRSYREQVYHRDGPRIEAAFRRYFFRSSPEQLHDSYLLIVGHSNVIRYFVCRALQFPPEAWARLSLNHGSITWLTISPKGHVTIKYLGDAGFMPVEHLTTRRPKVDQAIIEKV